MIFIIKVIIVQDILQKTLPHLHGDVLSRKDENNRQMKQVRAKKPQDEH
jgi:hypothetical protein